MNQIDSKGTFLGTVEESGVGITKKSQFPQWVARLKATKKWIDDPEGMAHFQMTEPGYVDWSSFDEGMVAYLVLFKATGADDSPFNDQSKLLNYEQLQLATGWDGASFDSLADGSLVGKEILFRVEDHEYEGKTSLQVAWIDSKDADAVAKLRTLDANDVKNLSAKLKMGGLGKKAAPAKPAAPVKPAAATKPGKPGAAPQSAPSASAPAASSATASTATAPATPAAPAPKAPPKKGKKAAEPAAPAAEAAPAGLPSTCSQGEAWEWCCNNKGGNEDSVVEEAWIAACAEVGGDKDEDKFTPEDWAKVRDLVKKDLAL